jgi:hypothetical protein
MRHLVVDNSQSLTIESIPDDKTYFPEKKRKISLPQAGKPY